MAYPYPIDSDIEKLNICTDLHNWKSEITYHDLENQFYLKLFSSELIKKAGISAVNVDLLNRELMLLDDEKENLTYELGKTLLELEKNSDNDALSWPESVLLNYQKLKIELQNYAFRNRKLKVLIYSYLSQGMRKFL
ncbi:hypothetical protein GCM10007103_14040 [Salinimicrobium marinum]|uniref:Uncharacterized protein n=1 Tax=Salinimicrobium marinum TaxID=680283 RepID=A0A918SB62_9FLAO|nr:hypothetical protein [Salinimicrobium marinum]GHA33678.1 hypothetical protein GCM10007103_14040 [Salinimicrobium marinum]